jgi:hypothetical protein
MPSLEETPAPRRRGAAAGPAGVPRFPTSRFVRVPSARWLEKFTYEEADALDLGIMAGVVALAQKDCGVGHRQVTMRLRHLHAALNPGIGERAFSDRLKKLRKLGEIEFETRQGQRGPLVITIVPSDYFGPQPAADERHSLELASNMEAAPGHDFEATSYDLKPELPAIPTSSDREPALPPRSTTAPAPPDQKHLEEKQPNQSGESCPAYHARVAESVSESLRTAADGSALPVAEDSALERLLSLLPPHQRDTSARTGIARKLETLPPSVVDNVVEDYRAEQAHGEIRKPLAYLYGILNKRLKPARRTAATTNRLDTDAPRLD